MGNGTKQWYLERHREDGPAVEYVNGTKRWYASTINYTMKMVTAVEWANGARQWYFNDQLHREDGHCSWYLDMVKDWYLNGERHRERPCY